jgi:ribose 5-phosphate isomerase B
VEGKPLVAVGSDHAGVAAKGKILARLAEMGYPAVDLGPATDASVDYPDFAEAVAKKVADGEAAFGVLVCGTGLGMAIAANKVTGVRAAILYDDVSARFARLHNDANVAVFGSRTMTDEEILDRLALFLGERFEGGRHQGRIDKIARIEHDDNCK